MSLPLAADFNDKICMDLKQWRGRHILHMIDLFSRLTVSVFISRKEPKQVIDSLLTHWIGYFGIPRAILNDNGGEFTAAEIKEVKSILNVIDLTTGAESPFQNGICEKNHALVDSMLDRMVEDYPDTSHNVLLSWANMAKKSMQMVFGYSSNQIVFGTHPNLPGIMTDGPPALDGKTLSETFKRHWNALHSAREVFVKSESCSRLRRALLTKVCSNNTEYLPGDQIYYLSERHKKWMGPAKIIFQDGKVLFIRHGSTVVRASPSHVTKRGMEMWRGSSKEKEGNPDGDQNDKITNANGENEVIRKKL